MSFVRAFGENRSSFAKYACAVDHLGRNVAVWPSLVGPAINL